MRDDTNNFERASSFKIMLTISKIIVLYELRRLFIKASVFLYCVMVWEFDFELSGLGEWINKLNIVNYISDISMIIFVFYANIPHNS